MDSLRQKKHTIRIGFELFIRNLPGIIGAQGLKRRIASVQFESNPLFLDGTCCLAVNDLHIHRGPITAFPFTRAGIWVFIQIVLVCRTVTAPAAANAHATFILIPVVVVSVLVIDFAICAISAAVIGVMIFLIAVSQLIVQHIIVIDSHQIQHQQEHNK